MTVGEEGPDGAFAFSFDPVPVEAIAEPPIAHQLAGIDARRPAVAALGRVFGLRGRDPQTRFDGAEFVPPDAAIDDFGATPLACTASWPCLAAVIKWPDTEQGTLESTVMSATPRLDKMHHSKTRPQHRKAGSVVSPRPGNAAVFSLESTVTDCINQLLATDPSVRRVAAVLALNVRTLQRRLAAGGRSYRELLDDCRQREAISLLSSSRLSIQEISRRLGYSDPAHFVRAFRRWTGQSPSRYAARPAEPRE